MSKTVRTIVGVCRLAASHLWAASGRVGEVLRLVQGELDQPPGDRSADQTAQLVGIRDTLVKAHEKLSPLPNTLDDTKDATAKISGEPSMPKAITRLKLHGHDLAGMHKTVDDLRTALHGLRQLLTSALAPDAVPPDLSAALDQAHTTLSYALENFATITTTDESQVLVQKVDPREARRARRPRVLEPTSATPFQRPGDRLAGPAPCTPRRSPGSRRRPSTAWRPAS